MDKEQTGGCLLYLVRHGETIDNERQLMQGQIQGELNETGLRQARELSVKMAQEPIDVFVASDLKRAIDTCRIVAEPHGKDVVTTPLLRERDWGDFTGRYIPDLKGLPFPDNVESLDSLFARARDFLHFIRTNRISSISTHNHAVRTTDADRNRIRPVVIERRIIGLTRLEKNTQAEVIAPTGTGISPRKSR